MEVKFTKEQVVELLTDSSYIIEVDIDEFNNTKNTVIVTFLGNNNKRQGSKLTIAVPKMEMVRMLFAGLGGKKGASTAKPEVKKKRKRVKKTKEAKEAKEAKEVVELKSPPATTTRVLPANVIIGKKTKDSEPLDIQQLRKEYNAELGKDPALGEGIKDIYMDDIDELIEAGKMKEAKKKLDDQKKVNDKKLKDTIAIKASKNRIKKRKSVELN